MALRSLDLSNISDVIIYPFFECNLKCKGCPVSEPLGGSGFLRSDPDEFREHIEERHVEKLLSWNVKNFIILGGEPFLSKYLPRILSTLNGKVIVYTNATLLYPTLSRYGLTDKLEAVLSLIDRLVISLEGQEDWTDKIRGKGVYRKAKYVIDYLVNKADSKLNLEIAVRMGYFEKNIGSVLRELRSLSELNIPCLLFPRIDQPPLDRDKVYQFYSIVASFDNADILLPSYKNFLGISNEGVTCPAGWNKVCLLPSGYLTPCQWYFRKVAHVDWDDYYIEQAFTAWYRKMKKIKIECLGCKYAEVCMSSCMVAKDYLTCPVREGLQLEDKVKIDFYGEIREVSKSKIVERVRKIGLIAHGCSAGC